MQHFYEYERDEEARTWAWYLDNNAYYAHFHSSIELVYVLEGEISATLANATLRVGPGQLMLISSYMLHAYETPETSRSLVATIPLQAVGGLRAQLSQSEFQQSVVDVHTLPEVQSILTMMAAHSGGNNDPFVNSLAEALLSLLIQVVGLKPAEFDAEGDLLRQMLIYLQENACEAITLGAVAAHFGYSPGRFSHIFNQRVGCSFPKYLNTLRCAAAQRMLVQGDRTLTDIAAASGFSSMRSFHRVYKEMTGQTPGSNVKPRKTPGGRRPPGPPA